MTRRCYPDDPITSFERPPETLTDQEGRTIDIEPLEADEVDPLVDMYDGFDPVDRAQGLPPTGRQSITDWLDTILDDGLHVVAWHGETVVGHAMLVPDSTNDSWELAIFVTQDYQGAGIGSRLIRLLLGYGAAHGVERVWLTVERWNTAAIELYESVGFEPADTDRFELELSIRLA